MRLIFQLELCYINSALTRIMRIVHSKKICVLYLETYTTMLRINNKYISKELFL